MRGRMWENPNQPAPPDNPLLSHLAICYEWAVRFFGARPAPLLPVPTIDRTRQGSATGRYFQPMAISDHHIDLIYDNVLYHTLSPPRVK